MNFFQKIGNSLARFMYGRNGVEALVEALLHRCERCDALLGLCVLRTILLLALESIVPARIADVLLWGVLVGLFFRMFSKNLSKRRAENAAYMNKVVYPLRQALSRSRDKEHKYFTCPNCRTVCRVPRGKGRIVITCPKCHNQFIKKS